MGSARDSPGIPRPKHLSCGPSPGFWNLEFRVPVSVPRLVTILVRKYTFPVHAQDICSSPDPSPVFRIFQISDPVPVPIPTNFEFVSRSKSQILLGIPVPVRVQDFQNRDCGIPETLSRMPTLATDKKLKIKA